MRLLPARRTCTALALALVAATAGTVPLSSSAAAAPSTARALGVPAQSSFDPLDNGDPVQVRVLSGRADLVSGGDALVEVVLPAGTDTRAVRVRAGERDVTSVFRPAGPGLRGLVTGLPLGRSTVTATLRDGSGARLVVTNAPSAGPVFSGPLIQPWTCTNGSAGKDCAQAPTVEYVYRSTDPSKAGLPGRTVAGPVRSGLQPYDPEQPPGDVATTTTDEGNEVPFIVRVETGYSLRDQYRIAALWDPAQGGVPSPTDENPGYADKLVLTHGSSCDTAYESGTAPDVLFEDALAQGFAVASHALDNAGHNCNIATQAEALVMVKEMVVERFGPLRYTIGSGCSGGSLVQQQLANAYPGIYQGITPQCSFTDSRSSGQQYFDYVLLRDYLEDPATLPEHQITPAQWPAIYGHANPANQITFLTVIANSAEPTRECQGLTPEQVYDERTNPGGVRCTIQDYSRNVYGLDATGKAYRPSSNVGIQYGLSGLLAFLEGVRDPSRPPLTPAQFVALNANAGGYDLDFNPTAARTKADPLALERVYRSGAANTGANMDTVAIIDLGGPEPGAFHDVYRKYSMRERLVREHGTAENQVFWEGQLPLMGDASFVEDSIRAMDDWLAAVEADRSATPLAEKIIAARAKAGVTERCVTAGGTDAPLSLCDATVDPTVFSSPRVEAGGGDTAPVNGVGPAKVGLTDDRLECQRTPLEGYVFAGRSFADVFDAAQQQALRTAFPDGVCDYSRPGVGFQAAVPWLRYQDASGRVVFGGAPMGAAPTSVYFAPTARVSAPVTSGGRLPATGPVPVVALGALALLGAAAAVTRRASRPVGRRSQPG